MKFFIASPWRNAEAVKNLADALAARGHSAYSFLDNGANLATGSSVYENRELFDDALANRMDDPRVERIFAAEMQKLKESDEVILLEPADVPRSRWQASPTGRERKLCLSASSSGPRSSTACARAATRSVEAFLRSLPTSGS